VSLGLSVFLLYIIIATFIAIVARKKLSSFHLMPAPKDSEDITDTARILCRAAFDLELPAGWRVRVDEGAKYVDVLEQRLTKQRNDGYTAVVLGDCVRPLKEISIHRGRHISQAREKDSKADELDTLLHELVHCLFPKMEHGWRFDQEVRRAKAELWRKAGV
jgi:hypothetical protein